MFQSSKKLKELETISRRPSFSDTLDEILKAPKKAGNNGYLMRKSTTTGAMLKRWFVIHGHYLSYFKSEPTSVNDKPMYILNLWEVQGVSLEGSTITLLRSGSDEEGDDEDGSSGSTKKNPLLSNTYKNLDKWRGMLFKKSKFIVKANNTVEAQAWLALMRDSPLKAQLLALKLEASAEGKQEEITLQEVAFQFNSGKQVIFGETVSSLIGDGATDMHLGTDEPGEITIKLSNGTSLKTSFAPQKEEANGDLKFTGKPVIVHMKWQRKPKADIISPMEALPLGVIGVVAFALLFMLTKKNWMISLAVSVVVEIALVGALQFYHQWQQKDIIISSIVLEKVAVEVAAAAPTRRAGGPRLGVSKDKNVTPEEAGACDELRERLKDMWEVNKERADKLMKVHEKFLKEFHADLNAMYDKESIKLVMDKHILTDFRLVRFLRGRKHDVDKAEQFCRDALLWRVALGSDVLYKDKECNPPAWLMGYFASPWMLKHITSPETRLAKLYGRDKEGHVMVFARLGRQTSRKVFKKMAGKVGFMAKYFLRSLEILRDDLDILQAQTGAETIITMVFDLEGFSISEQVGLSDLVAIARRIFPVIATQFVELLRRVLVFNAPWLFGTLWSALKPFIPEEVQDKIQIHSGSVVFAKHIEPYVPPEHVPKYFGGTKVDEEDGNPFCMKSCVAYAPYHFPSEGIPEYLEGGVDKQAETW